MTYQDLLKILSLDNDNVYEGLVINEGDIFKLIPELKNCKGFEQNNKWHIYDVYEHILHVVSGVENNICLRIAALFHDIGKPSVYTEDDNKAGHFYGHWNKSVEIFEKYKDKFNLTEEQIVLVKKLIFYHDINIEKLSNKELEDMILAIGVENIKLLFMLKRADLLAQSPEYHYLLSNILSQENETNAKINLLIHK